MKLTTLIIFPQPYYQVAVCDADGQQIAELQLPLIELWCRFAEQKGYNPDGIQLLDRARKLMHTNPKSRF